MNINERANSIEMCKWVDKVVRNAPWIPTLKMFYDNNYDFIAHDAEPYIVPGQDDCYKCFKEKGLFLPTLRTEGISTTDLIGRILYDKDELILRNVSKGQSFSSLNITHLEYLLIKAKKYLSSLSFCKRRGEKLKAN